MKPQDQADPKSPGELPLRIRGYCSGGEYEFCPEQWEVAPFKYPLARTEVEYISLQEHQQEIRKLEEAVRVAKYEALDAAITGLGEVVRHQGYEHIPSAGVYTDPWRDKCFFAHEKLMALKNKLEDMRAKSARAAEEKQRREEG